VKTQMFWNDMKLLLH